MRGNSGDGALVVYSDNFTELPVGEFPYDYTPLREYHFFMPSEMGGWQEGSLFHAWRKKNARGNWSVIEEEGRHAIEQSTVADQRAIPLLFNGDQLWSDYTLQVEMRSLSSRGRAGIAGRLKDSFNYYALYLEENNRLVLARASTTAWTVLGETPCTVSSDYPALLTLTFNGETITGELTDPRTNNSVKIETNDTALKEGRIGIWGDVPARFYKVQVEASPRAQEVHAQKLEERQREVAGSQEQLPYPVLWKKLDTKGFGCGHSLRFGDLNGDGVLEVVMSQNLPRIQGDSYSMISCITAMTLEGEVLWQIGEPSTAHALLTNDVGIQLYDLDGDGCDEVIYAKDFQIHIADGRTGRTLRKTPTPKSRVPAHPRGFGPETAFDRIIGDSLFICNVRGLERPRDILIKDRYNDVWIYSDDLELLWSVSANTGHYPFSMDVDGDGRDELFIGDSLFDHDGQLIWSLNLPYDHIDTVGVADLTGNGEPTVILGGGDEGLLFVNMQGQILKRHWLGHVQMGNVAKLRQDVPGLQVFTITYWRYPGIVTILDAQGDVIESFQPLPIGSAIEPLNWTGDGTEFILFSGSMKHPGIIDGYGRNILNLPDDGHPELCCKALDLTGDPRDEIIVWDPESIWIYTQDNSGKLGERIYAPTRLPHYNESSYRAAISLPAWQERG